jgi:hypothetical protein
MVTQFGDYGRFSIYHLVTFMNITLNLIPIVSLVAGILILIIPRLLNMIVAIYLIAVGVVGLLGANHFLH